MIQCLKNLFLQKNQQEERDRLIEYYRRRLHEEMQERLRIENLYTYHLNEYIDKSNKYRDKLIEYGLYDFDE